MITCPALELFLCFINDPTPQNASCLVMVPVFYDVLKWEEVKGNKYPPLLLGLFKWIYQRGQDVLKALIIHPAPPLDLDAATADPGWKVVCRLIVKSECLLT